MKRIRQTSFSDAAKRRAGVAPYDMAAEIKGLKAQLQDSMATHAADLGRLRARIRDAITALEEQRRGDGLAILRGLVRTSDGRLALPAPADDDTPRRA